MPTKKTWTNEQLIKAVPNNISIAGILKELNLKPIGGNYKTVQKHIKTLGLDISHLKGQGYLKGKKHNWTKKALLKDILIENSPYGYTSHLSKKLVKEGILHYHCQKCGLSDWNNEPISLHLDHINGNNIDNRLENLRLLCPNCHSQTETYCRSKNIL